MRVHTHTYTDTHRASLPLSVRNVQEVFSEPAHYCCGEAVVAATLGFGMRDLINGEEGKERKYFDKIRRMGKERESYARLWMKGKRGGKTSDKLRKKGRRENL